MNKFIKPLFVVAVATISLTSCRDTEDPVTPNTTHKEVIANLTNNVVITTYQDLNTKATNLKSKISALTIGNDAALAAAKQAWIETRSPWEKSEGFLYGPVDTEGIDPAMDTWPVDVTAMNAILNSSQAITPALIASNPEARGFHLIEFLLWGENGDKTASQFTARQLEYLNAAATDLQNNTNALYTGWIASGGNFAQYFINPTSTSPKYKSEKEVLVEITDGIFTICDEVGNGKIEDPLNGNNGSAAPEKEESRFSNNSKQDFADNIRSVKNMYLGGYNATGKGLSDVVKAKNATLDTEMKTKIDAAISAIEAIPGTFSTAIISNRPAVENAQAKVQDLMTTVQTKVKPLVNGL